MKQKTACGALITSLFIVVTGPVAVGQPAGFEGSARGFPALRDSAGKKLADSDFSQWLERDRLHVKIRHVFDGSHWIEERSVFNQNRGLVQEEWSWREHSGGRVDRDFRVDFRSAIATASKVEGTERKQWSEKVEIADVFIDVPDILLWLTNPGPAGFLRMEGPLVEPSDPILRIDVLPGGQSGPATPTSREKGQPAVKPAQRG